MMAGKAHEGVLVKNMEGIFLTEERAVEQAKAAKVASPPDGSTVRHPSLTGSSHAPPKYQKMPGEKVHWTVDTTVASSKGATTKAGGDSAPVIIPERFNADNTLQSQAKGAISNVDAIRSQQTPAMPGNPEHSHKSSPASSGGVSPATAGGDSVRMDKGNPPSAQTPKKEPPSLAPKEHSRNSSPASGGGVSPATWAGDGTGRIVLGRPNWLESDPESVDDSDADSDEIDVDTEYRKLVFDASQIEPIWHSAAQEGRSQLIIQPIEEVNAAYAAAARKKVSEVPARKYDPVRRFDVNRDDKKAIAEGKTVWGALM